MINTNTKKKTLVFTFKAALINVFIFKDDITNNCLEIRNSDGFLYVTAAVGNSFLFGCF